MHFKLFHLKIFFSFIILFNLKVLAQNKDSEFIFKELGNYVIKNYDNTFLDRPESIWSVIKSSNEKLLYYGTFNGIIEYDGKKIRKIKIQGDIESEVGSEYVKNIIETETGEIFVSGPSVLGVLFYNEFATKEYFSLLNQIPDSINPYQQNFLATKEYEYRIYSNTPEKIFRWDGQEFDKIWNFSDYEGSIDSDGKLHFLFKVGDRLFVRQWGVGLLELIDDNFEFVEGSEFYSNNRIEAMHSLSDNQISIFSSTNGAYLLNDDGTFTKSKNKLLNNWLVKAKVQYVPEVSLFSDGSIPIISNEGILILNSNLEIVNLINESDGLLSSQITSMFIDENDGMFITNLLSSAKIDFDNSLTEFDRSAGVKGVVTKIKRIDDELFFSTTEDIFSLKPNNDPFENASINEIGLDDYVRDFNSFNNSIVSTNNYGVIEYNDKSTKKVISDRDINLPIQSKLDKNILIVAHPSDGIVLLKKNKNGILKEFNKSKPASDVGVLGFRELKPGSLYVEASDGEGSFIAEYDFKGNFKYKRLLTPENDSIYKSLNLPKTLIFNSDLEDYFFEPTLSIFNTGVGYLVFDLIETKIYRFDENLNLTPLDKNMSEIFEKGINFNYFNVMNGIDQFTDLNDQTGNNWFLTGAGMLEVKFNQSTYEVLNLFNYGKIDLNELKGSFLVETKNNIETIWLGSKDSKLIRWSPKINSKSSSNIPSPLIKEIILGDNLHNVYESSISYDDSRSMIFNLAFPSFNKEENNQYRVFLEGQDEQWTAWNSNSERSYTNLGVGDFNFLIQAKDTSGNESEIVSYPFVINPPFYRTYYAWALYLIILVLFIFIFNKIMTKRLLSRQDNKRKADELQEAKEMQENMLPKIFPKSEHFEISAGLITSTEVGGDYYDFFESDKGEVFAVCGDATGHGTTSGMMVSIIKSALNSLPSLPVNKILEELNRIVKKIDLKRIKMSLAISQIKKDKIIMSAAAMPPIYFYNAKSKECEEILIQGIPLGGLKNETYLSLTKDFNKNDIVVMLSDGLPEAVNKKNEMYDYDRLKDFILQNISKSADEIKDLLLNELNKWMDGIVPEDDVTFVVVKKK
tara:strand:+ start:240 stop:3488 length:3249 start_codon:yes stop_codon:yes gene_type:complete